MSKAVWTYLPKITWMKNKPTKRCFMFQVTNKMKLKAIMKYLYLPAAMKKKKKIKAWQYQVLVRLGSNLNAQTLGNMKWHNYAKCRLPEANSILTDDSKPPLFHTHTHKHPESCAQMFHKAKKTEKKTNILGYLWTNKLRYICTMQYFSNEKEQSGSVSNRLC